MVDGNRKKMPFWVEILAIFRQPKSFRTVVLNARTAIGEIAVVADRCLSPPQRHENKISKSNHTRAFPTDSPRWDIIRRNKSSKLIYD